jgi:hypothetical protein
LPRDGLRALVHLYSPGYLISALAALASLHPAEVVAATILVHLPGAPDADQSEMLAVARELASGHPSVAQVVGFRDAELAGLDAQGLRARLGEGFDDFLYSHDLGGQLCRRLAAAYPSARKVCTGDAFGMVYTADFVARYHAPRTLRARARALLRNLARRAALQRELAPLTPDVAALALPVDPSGEALSGVRLVVVSAADFRAVARHCHERAGGLRAYMQELLQKFGPRRRYLLLTETYVEAGHVRAAREAQMYAEIVRRHCEPGSTVLVKPHPQQAPGTAARLQAVLGGTHQVVETEPRFRRYPVEIWDELLRGCTVLSTAYPVLSLKYVHGIDAVQSMDEAFIARWIEPAHQAWVRDSLRLYMEPLARLKDWDGRSLLWPKPRERAPA